MASQLGTAATLSLSLGALNAAVSASTDGAAGLGVGAVGAQIGAGLTGTIIFEATIDGVNWFTVAALPAAGGQAVQTVVNPAASQYLIPALAYAAVRVRVSAYTSGSTTVALDPVEGPMPLVTPNGGGFKDSLNYQGNAVAPGAGGNVIAAVTPGVQGQYLVNIAAGLSFGTPVAGDVCNMGLYKTGSLIQTLAYPVNGVAPQPPIKVTLLATDTLAIKAIAAGTASVNYSAVMTAALLN